MESFSLNGFRNPQSFFVFFNQFWFDICDFDEPAVECTIDQGGLGAPAERIAVPNGAGVNHTSSLLQISHNVFVSIFNILALIIRDFLGKFAIGIQRNRGFTRLNESSCDA